MDQTVSVLEKKEFLRWFLKRYQMKRKESVWILCYLISQDKLLEKLHFVEEAHYCPRSMVISVTDSAGVPFRFYIGEAMTANAGKAFHDLKNHKDEDTYIQLNFNHKTSIEYLGVLEEHPFMPKGLYVNDKDSQLADELIEHVMKLSKEENFNRMINEALDTGNKKLFRELTSQMVTT